MFLSFIELKLVKGYILETFSKVFKSWSLVFSVKPLATVSGYSIIIHATIGSDDGVYGDRIPGVFMEPNSTRLYVRTAVNGDKAKMFQNCVKHLPLHSFTEVRIEQSYEEKLTKMKFNGTLCQQMVNNDMREFQNVKVYASNPWWEPANAVIMGYSFTTGK